MLYYFSRRHTLTFANIHLAKTVAVQPHFSIARIQTAPSTGGKCYGGNSAFKILQASALRQVIRRVEQRGRSEEADRGS